MVFFGICLITEDVGRLSSFYSEVLGVEAIGDETHIELKTQGGAIAIFSVEGMEKMAPQSMAGAGYGSVTISFMVEDTDREYNRVKAMGVDIIMVPTTHPWGTRSFWFRDPDRNIVNFVSSVKS